MTNERFLQYLQQHFIPSLKDQGTKFPVLLTLGGASTHISYEIHGNDNFLFVGSNFNYDLKIEFCVANAIILVALPPNTTHLLQP
jgi:hypothetical protein